MTKLNKLTNLELCTELLKDPDRKPLLRIIYELFYLFFLYRELPVHYFSRYLFKKGTTNIKDYLPNHFLGKKITHVLNDYRVKEVLDNKLFFDLFYRQFNISLPKILMYNHRSMFVANNKLIKVNNAGDFRILLAGIFKNNPSYDSILIKKTCSSSSGFNIYKLFKYQVKENLETIYEIYSEVIKTEFLFQETVKQHSDLNKLNSSCLNTIRMDTFIDCNGKIAIISGYARMSINNLYVDNISSGGCQVGIDLNNGRLKKNGYSRLKSSSMVKVLTEHPITKTIFENFNIPFFPQAKELVLKTASCMPGLRLVGWDVAIGESGPVLIEGNSDYYIGGNDLADEGYLANTEFRKILHEINFL